MIIAIALNLLPDLIMRSPRGAWWLQGWIDNLIQPTQRFDAQLGLWGSAIEYNQSLSGTVQRLVNTQLVFFPTPQVLLRPLVDAGTLKSILYPTFFC